MITVDLHSHILPGMDDGAKDTSISLELLKMEAEQGIEHIVSTPHFHLRNENIANFAERRKESFEKLKNSISGTSLDGLFDFHLGAEVRYDPSLTEEKILILCAFPERMFCSLNFPHPIILNLQKKFFTAFSCEVILF